MKFTPYILFDGNCADAMNFYQTCLGGDLKLTKVADTPMKAGLPEAQHHKVINSRLVSGPIDLTACDWLHPTRKPKPGNTVCMYFGDGTYEELKGYFDKLSEGADPDLLDPLTQQPFGTYGALTDKFGIRWMFQGN